jgi:hypothetical protein
MSSTLTPLESDFLHDLCEDDQQIWHAFDFVRVHGKSFSDEEVFESGKKFLRDCLQRGWIDIVERKDTREKMRTDALAKFFEKTGMSLMTQFDSTVWVEIAEKGEEVFNFSKSPA